MSSEKVVLEGLLATWNWKESILELNTVNSTFKLEEVSLSKLNKIKKLNFSEYAVKKPRNNFARCSTCDKFHAL